MNTQFEKLKQEPQFLEFVNREFEYTASNSTIEELAEFAFGSEENAIEKYNNFSRKIDESTGTSN